MSQDFSKVWIQISGLDLEGAAMNFLSHYYFFPRELKKKD